MLISHDFFVANADHHDIAEVRHAPREERIGSAIPVTVVDTVGRELDATMGNFSPTGFMIECEQPLPPGETIVTDHPFYGKVNAEIRWCSGWQMGALITGRVT